MHHCATHLDAGHPDPAQKVAGGAQPYCLRDRGGACFEAARWGRVSRVGQEHLHAYIREKERTRKGQESRCKR